MKKIYSLLIFATIFIPAKSQNMPEYDIIKTSEGVMTLHFIGHGSLMISVGEFIIHIDPVRSSGSYASRPKADLILVTHEHGDHLDPQLIEDLRKQNTILLTSERAGAKMEWARLMKVGERNVVNNITVEAVPAYNIVNMRAPDQPFHPKGSGLGFVIGIGDKKVYVAGDTENTPEMKALKDIDIAFLPMNLPYTMTPAMVADAALAFRPKILYPYHYGDTDTKIIESLLRDSGIEVRIRDLK